MQPVVLKACRPLEVHHHEGRELRKAVVGAKWTTMRTLHPLLQSSDLAGTASQKVLAANEIRWRVDGPKNLLPRATAMTRTRSAASVPPTT